jgi:hypothetical protein
MHIRCTLASDMRCTVRHVLLHAALTSPAISNSNKPLAATHPFEVLKRRFYLQNTPESVGQEWANINGGGLKSVLNTVLLPFAYGVCPPAHVAAHPWQPVRWWGLRTLRTMTHPTNAVQRGFYDENARRVLLANPYSEQCETLRQLCCHPAACEQWEKWRKAAGSVGSATPLEGLRKKMLHHKQQALEHTTADVRTRSLPSIPARPSIPSNTRVFRVGFVCSQPRNTPRSVWQHGD